MAVTYAKFYYDYKVDGDFVTWLNSKHDPPDKWELVSILPYGSPYVDGGRIPPDGNIAMRCVCIFKK